MQGEHKNREALFKTIRRYPVLFSLLFALLIYIIIFISTVIWLSINEDVTTQRRIAQSPSVTVIIKKPDAPKADAASLPDETPVPPSWDQSNPALPGLTNAPDAETAPAIEQDQPPAAAPQPEKQAPAETIAPEAVVTDTPVEKEMTTVIEAPKAAWQKLAHPFDQNDKRPRIALIVTNLGVTNTITKQAIDTLPADVTLAFQSVAPAASDWIAKSYNTGHENLLAVPMEPYRYPQNDPGPQTLLTMLSKEENAKRLGQAMSHVTNVLGIIPAQGEKFITDERAMAPVLDTIKQNGLIFVDGTQSDRSAALSLTRLARLPFVRANIVIDAAASRQAIDLALTALEAKAKQDGQAVAIVLPYPATFERLDSWIKTLPEKNMVLAPISAMIAPVKPDVAAIPATEASSTPVKDIGTDVPSDAKAVSSETAGPAPAVTPKAP